MSKLDLVSDEKTLLHVNELHKDLIGTSEVLLNQGYVANFSQMDIDLEAWLKIFEEDQVTMEGCR